MSHMTMRMGPSGEAGSLSGHPREEKHQERNQKHLSEASNQKIAQRITCKSATSILLLGVAICTSAALLSTLAAGQSHLIKGAEAAQQQSNSSSIENHKQQQQQRGHNKQNKQTSDHLFEFRHAELDGLPQVDVVGAAAASASSTCDRPLRPLDHPEQPASLSSSLLRAYIRTNNMRAYHLDLHSYRPDAKFIGDPEFVDSQSEAHVQRCRRHLGHYQSLLDIFRQTDPMEMTSSLDSLKLADTFGRPGAGLLDGNQFWLGSYERCLDLKGVRVPSAGARRVVGVDDDELALVAKAAPSETVNSQYCLGLAQFPSWNPKDTKTSIKIGMCLPETCTSSMLNDQADLLAQAEHMMKHNLGDSLPFNKLRLRSVYCLPHETSQVRQYSLSAKLFMSVISTFVVACLYATLSDYLNKKTTATPTIKLVAAESSADDISRGGPAREASGPAAQSPEPPKQQIKLVLAGEERTWRNVFVESFSLIRNFDKITTIPKRREETTVQHGQQEAGAMFDRDMFFRCVTGIKCLGLLWILSGHTFLVGPIMHSNLITLDQLTKTYLANAYLSAHLLVDTFFALSGLLASYLIFSKGIHKFQLSHWVIMTIHRYWRLTPVYLICYWFAKSMGHLSSGGPLWDYQTAAQSPRLNCANESWLEAILHRSDFKSPKSHCVPFAWFIANGIKFWMVTPLFLIAIYHSMRRGYALVCATILANIAIVFTLAINSPVDMKSVLEFKPESADNMLNEMEDIYTRPYSRIGAYLVGLLAGHWFYSWELKQQRMNLSEKTKIAIWSLVSITMIVLAFVVKIAGGFQLEEAAIPYVFSFCSAIIRPLWALCTCWLVFALSHGQARWLAKFVGARGWLVLAKLSFSAYLVQGEVIANLYLNVSHSGPYFYSDMITRPVVAAVATIGAAFLMAIFVEYPLIGIEELILPSKELKRAIDTANKAGEKSTATATANASQTVKVLDSEQHPDKLKQTLCDFNNVSQPNGHPTLLKGAGKLKEL